MPLDPPKMARAFGARILLPPATKNYDPGYATGYLRIFNVLTRAISREFFLNKLF